MIVYLSGPITLGDREHNFQQAAAAQKRLMAAGHSVINPMLTMRLPGAWEIPHAQWIAHDLPIIERCDAVVRLPGPSIGADTECQFALDNNIPVLDDLDQLLACPPSSSD